MKSEVELNILGTKIVGQICRTTWHPEPKLVEIGVVFPTMEADLLYDYQEGLREKNSVTIAKPATVEIGLMVKPTSELFKKIQKVFK